MDGGWTASNTHGERKMSNLMTRNHNPYNPWLNLLEPDRLLRDFETWTSSLTVSEPFLFRKDKDTYELEAPGVKREDINVSLDGQNLCVKWKDRHGVERLYKHPVGKVDDVKAKLADGVLTLSLIRPQDKKVQIEIE
jgi:HSP20 family molecular chaperone IbpA